MHLTLSSPTRAYVTQATDEELASLREQLTYKDLGVAHELKRISKNHWFKSSNPEKWELTVKMLKEQVYQTLVFEEDGPLYIRPGSIPYLKDLTLEIDDQIIYPKPKKIPWAKTLPFELYPYQKESVEKLIQAKHGNVSLTTGCHAKGTDILMFDGTIKKVEDVIVGDSLMGPDSKPRNVLELHAGTEKMYKIIPVKGQPFVVNEGHILSLQHTNYINKRIKNISVKDYLGISKAQKNTYKLYREKVDFSNPIKNEIPPYILGLWLGDGSSNAARLTSMDKELSDIWTDYIISLGMEVSIKNMINNKSKQYDGIIGKNKSTRIGSNTRQNKFNILLHKHNLIKNKHIPFSYLTSSREHRLQLLAGLIDTDGNYYHGCFEIIQKNIVLANNILYLARSLGFGTSTILKLSRDQNGVEGAYTRINISGDLSVIPTKLSRKQATPRKQIKNVLRTGFAVESAGEGNYYGFSVDGDNLYLMGDFTVTHNSGKSACLLSLCRETGLNTAIIAPSKAIFNELVKTFEHHLGKGNIGKFGDGRKKLDKKITICIGDSLCNVKPNSEEWKFFSKLEMLCVDESHAWGSTTLEQVCHGVFSEIPWRFFLSATQTRGDGGVKLLQSIIGPTVHTLTTKEAIEGGYICKHDYRIVQIQSSDPNITSTDALEIKRQLFLRNRNIASFAAKLANVMASKNEQTLILVEELGQIAMLNKLVTVPFGYAHSETKKERLAELGLEKVDVQDQIDRFNRNEIKVLAGTAAIHVGCNIFPMTTTINWVGGASEIKTRQAAIGRSIRLPQANPYAAKCGKKELVTIFDFDIQGNFVLERHLESRVACYMDSGDNLIKYIRLK